MNYPNILPMAEDLMKFRILSATAGDVLGGAVSSKNFVFLGLEELLQPTSNGEVRIKKLADLQPNESVRARFNMSGHSGVYTVKRVE
jgi:hypothetical protein